MKLITITTLASLSAVAFAQDLKIHGKPVSPECLKAFKAAQAPEIDRTLKFRYLAGNVTQPADLKERAMKASTALQTYQDILIKVDSNLADPATKDDIMMLVKAHRATDDVEGTLEALSKSEEAPVKAALKEFTEARKLEMTANTLVQKSCPADVDELSRLHDYAPQRKQ